MRRLIAIALLAFCLAPRPADAAARPYASAAPQGETTVRIEAGKTKQVTLTFRNAGTATWRNTGKAYVSLYATGPYRRDSVFRHTGWPTEHQAARLKEASVKPGGTGSVTLTLQAPAATGTHQEQFQLAVEDVAWVYGSVARLKVEVVPPKTAAAPDPISAKAYVVMDAASGEVLASRQPDDVRSIASITKLMTVLVARDLGLDPDATYAIAKADEVGGGRLQVPVGTTLPLPAMLASTIVGSANNTANAIARSTGLTSKEFIARMDAKARDLGLTSSSFADPTGIEVENLSTAREVAMLARTAFADPWIAPYAAMPTYDVVLPDGKVRTIKNTNALLKDAAAGVTAGKTGYIDEAGYTLVTRLERGGRELIVVTLGSDTKALSFSDAKALAEKAWRQTKTASAR